MTYLLGVDTGGTYTDAVLLDDEANRVIAKAKALTGRPDLSTGISAAIDSVLAQAHVTAAEVGLVSLSTTLATNALVEGQGGRVALVFIGFAAAEQTRAGLQEALKGDPLISVAGGHDHAGREVSPLDLDTLRAQLAALGTGIAGFAIASSFATRNPAHELAARAAVIDVTGKPVTCSHELSSALGGPRRALTAVLNARLIGMIARLIDACEGHLARLGITAPLMVVRGDGALVPAALAREKPIETILSGPAASVAGARWLSGESHALISDIGGTTTDICLLRDGLPQIAADGARVGPFRTMVEAVDMRTTGLGGDSEVSAVEGLAGALRLGPRRLMPVSLLAKTSPDLVHRALDRALAMESPAIDNGMFAVPLWEGDAPPHADAREAAVAARLGAGPARLGDVASSRIDAQVLQRMVARGDVMLAGVTPSDAAHVSGLATQWDADAAHKALTLFARKRSGAGERLAASAEALADRIIAQLHQQSVESLLEVAFGEDDADWEGEDPATLARHGLTRAGLARHAGLVDVTLRLGVPVIGLGASAHAYYGPVGDRLGTRMIIPDHADVANAIGAVVGQVAMHAGGSVSASGPGSFVSHLPDGPQTYTSSAAALAALESALAEIAAARAREAGVDSPQVTTQQTIREATVEGQTLFVGADLRVTARGRPRIARESAA